MPPKSPSVRSPASTVTVPVRPATDWTGAAATRLATVTFLVVPCAEPVVSETSVMAKISPTAGVAPRAL